VVEVDTDRAGEMLGKLLGQMGADVVKVEPPAGAPGRSVGPILDGDAGEGSISFWYYNAFKRSVVIDQETDEGRTDLHRLIADADVLLCSWSNADQEAKGVWLHELEAAHPALVIVSITPFGLTGPWSSWKSSDLVALALGGPLITCGYDDHSIPPIRPGGDQAFQTATSNAHIALLLALVDRHDTGKGQLVDVSEHDTASCVAELANPYWFYSRGLVQRQTCRHAQPTPTQPSLFLCADGRHIYFVLLTSDQKQWRGLVDLLESKDLAVDLADPAYDDFGHRKANYPHIQEIVEVYFLLVDADEAFREGQRRGLPLGRVNAPEELLVDPHLEARGFFETVEHREGIVSKVPGAPYRFAGVEPVAATGLRSSVSTPRLSSGRVGSSPRGVRAPRTLAGHGRSSAAKPQGRRAQEGGSAEGGPDSPRARRRGPGHARRGASRADRRGEARPASRRPRRRPPGLHQARQERRADQPDRAGRRHLRVGAVELLRLEGGDLR
jgi:benzylsuccinate CoA-transferase BbsE subunit